MDNNLGMTLIIAGLASYRLARMIAYERGAFDCFEIMRQLIESGTEEDGWLRYGMTCPLCIGFWLSLVFVVLPQWVALPFAVAAIQTLLQKLDWMIKRYNTLRDTEVAALELDMAIAKFANPIVDLT